MKETHNFEGEILQVTFAEPAYDRGDSDAFDICISLGFKNPEQPEDGHICWWRGEISGAPCFFDNKKTWYQKTTTELIEAGIIKDFNADFLIKAQSAIGKRVAFSITKRDPKAPLVRFITRKSIYAEKLKSPRWQMVRLRRMEAADWRCEICGEQNKPLHVHHRKYIGENPWDTPDDFLDVLCEDCHAKEHL